MILRIKITPLPLLNLVTNCKDFATLVMPPTARVMFLEQRQPTTYTGQVVGKDSCGHRYQAGITQELCIRAKAVPVALQQALSEMEVQLNEPQFSPGLIWGRISK